MTNSILKPQNRLSIETRQQQHALNVLVELTNRSIPKMEKNLFQLKQIANDHFDVIIRMEAEKHLKKQSKMLSIAYELLARISDALEKSKNYENISQELIQQYSEERDLLVYMDFEVSKKYFSFIHDYFQSHIIPLNSMVA